MNNLTISDYFIEFTMVEFIVLLLFIVGITYFLYTFFAVSKYKKCAIKMQRKYKKNIKKIFENQDKTVLERHKEVQDLIWGLCGRVDIDRYEKLQAYQQEKQQELLKEIDMLKSRKEDLQNEEKMNFGHVYENKNIEIEELENIHNEKLNTIENDKNLALSKISKQEAETLTVFPEFEVTENSKENKYAKNIEKIFERHLYFTDFLKSVKNFIIDIFNVAGRGVLSLITLFFILVLLSIDLSLSNDFLTEILELYKTIGDQFIFLENTLIGDLSLEFAMALCITFCSFGSMAMFIFLLDKTSSKPSENAFKWMSFVVFLLIIGGLLLLASIHLDEDGVVLNASTIVSDVFRIIVFLALVLVADFVFKAFFLNQNYSWKEIMSPFLLISVPIIGGIIAMMILFCEIIRSIIQAVFYIIKTGFVDIYNIFFNPTLEAQQKKLKKEFEKQKDNIAKEFLKKKEAEEKIEYQKRNRINNFYNSKRETLKSKILEIEKNIDCDEKEIKKITLLLKKEKTEFFNKEKLCKDAVSF